MANWRCLFGWVKRLFTTEPKEKNPKKWRWCLGRFKLKKHPTITAATDRTLIEAKAEQRKHALTVAIATAAAAEAAVASANAAAEVVRLTGASRSYSYLSNGDRNLAAVKIQSAYRAHLARKALRALKGVVRLQAIVRGRAVRRRLSSTMKKSPSYARKQLGIQGSNHSEEERYKNDKIKQFPKQKRKLKEKEMKNEFCRQRTWNCSSHSREDIEAIWLRKQEAIVKRERLKQYSCSRREITIPQMVEESIPNKELGRESSPILGQWSSPILGQWLHKERAAALPSDLITKEFHDTTQVAQRNLKKEDFQEYGPSSQISISRRSFSHAKRSCFVDDSSMPNSPVFPTYMALTESTKAKARSLSTPRQRTRSMDVCSNQSFPQNEVIPFWSSCYGATTSTNENIEASKERDGRVQNAINIIRRC